MLDVTINQNLNCTSAGGVGSGLLGSSLDADDMDPLFDNDWLHEHNLDILFDLFEEEMERKNADGTGTNSSTLFSTSPVTSYLLGTSPSLASALDIYDLLYFDNQQPNNSSQQQQTTTSNVSLSTNSTTNINGNQTNHLNAATAATTTVTYNINDVATSNGACNSGSGSSRCYSKKQQGGQNVTTSHIANSITNAMRIKRGLKKGQNQGVSLLARPQSSNTSGGSTSGCSNNYTNSLINKNNSDKTSTKITNLKRTIMNNNSSSGGIDINQSRQRHPNRNKHHHHNYPHHHHYITGCAVIREHAYAVRGH